MLKKVKLTNIQNRQKSEIVVDTLSDDRALLGSGQMSNELAEISSISGVDEFIQRLSLPSPSMADRVGFFNGLAKCFERNIPTIKAFQLQVNRVKSHAIAGRLPISAVIFNPVIASAMRWLRTPTSLPRT